MTVDSNKPGGGRNAPCPCGSGKKQKRCCGTGVPAAAAATPIALVLEQAIVHHRAGRLREAHALYQQILGVQPNHGEALHLLADISNKWGDLGLAIRLLRMAIEASPDQAEYHNSLGNLLTLQGQVDQAIDSFRQALALQPDYPTAHSNMLMTLQYSLSYSSAEIYAEHRRFAAQFEAPLKAGWQPHDNQRSPGRRLKIGYVSGDLRKHAMAFFIEPVLANHDKSQVEVYCYYNYREADAVTARLKPLVEHWLDCRYIADAELAARIRADGIDILVDLSGHTAFNRLPMFARKPAPVQVNWIGYLGTSGLDAMDYRLTDQYMDPPGMTEAQHSETLLRLSASASYLPPPEAPAVNPLPALTAGHFTFACLNNLAKINPAMIALWSQIMLAVPGSRLMLGNVTSTTRADLCALFEQQGIDAGRLILHPKLPLADYLALHHQIDLAFDPFPYGGGTTTSHSLWMGVPVLTLAGDRPVARCGVALLAGAGLPQFIASSIEEYLEIALRAVHDLAGLNAVRQSLRAQKANQDNDPRCLTRQLEAVYRAIWCTWCESGRE